MHPSPSPHPAPFPRKGFSPWPQWPPWARIYSINICRETSLTVLSSGRMAWTRKQSLELLLPDPAKLWTSSQGPGSLAFVFGHWFSAIRTHPSDPSGRTCYASDVGGDNRLCTHTNTYCYSCPVLPTVHCTVRLLAQRGAANHPKPHSKAGEGQCWVGPEASWDHHSNCNNLWGKAREQQLGTQPPTMYSWTSVITPAFVTATRAAVLHILDKLSGS